MILFESHLIRLDYAPATDILTADLSSVYEFNLSDQREALRTLVTNVRHYDVKRLLMDSRKRIIQVDPEKYTALMTDFVLELGGTRLQKLARLHTSDTTRENIAKQMQEQIATTFIIKTFPAVGPAHEWLKAV
jgi:hypothetical protein